MQRPPEIPKLDLTEVERMQADLLILVEELAREPDSAKQAQLVRLIGDSTEALQRSCGALEMKARAAARELRGEIKVELTADQRRELKQTTGVDMSSVSIPDNGGGLVSAMPMMRRDQVMSYAVKEAARLKREEAARVVARAELDRIREDLKHAPEQVRIEIERLLKDPEFRRAFDEPRRDPK